MFRALSDCKGQKSFECDSMASRTPSRHLRKTPSQKKYEAGENEGSFHVQDGNQEVEEDIYIPPVNERLGYLRPSRELLEYYRKKIADFDGEHEDMLNKLEQYKLTYEQQHKMHWEVRQREEEIAELQKALSDMQVYLFQERDQVLRLYAENDRLKIREIEDRKRIQHLLSLGAPGDSEVTYFHKEPPAKAVVKHRKPLKQHPHENVSDRLALRHEVFSQNKTAHSSRKPSDKPDERGINKKGKASKSVGDENASPKGRHDVEILLLQIEALQAQMQEQAKLSKEQSNALLEDRRIRIEELQTVIERDRDKIESLQEKLHQTQNLLYDSTKDYLELKYEGRAHERHWMAEKDNLLQELDRCKEQLNVSKEDILHISDHAVEQRQVQTLEIVALENQVEQAQKLADMYREQVISLEEQLSRIREKEDVSKEAFKDRTEKLSKRLQLMNKRYEALEKRRNLEVEGFKNDIKTLRTKLKEVERQLYKVSLGVGEDGDLKMLKDIHKTAKRSKRMQGDLHHLKAAVYGMENDLRYL